MTTQSLPDWLRRGIAVVYYPRHDPDLAEAWPVVRLRETASTLVVDTEIDTDLRFRRVGLTMTGMWGDTTPILLPVDDPRVAAAGDRTDVMRVVHELTGTWRQHRPSALMPTEKIRESVAALADAAQVARDDLRALTTPQPS